MTVRIIPHAQWGAGVVPHRPFTSTPRGVVIHHTATQDISPEHPESVCRTALHTAERAEIERGYACVAYNHIVCGAHGVIYEGRGAHLKSGAQDCEKDETPIIANGNDHFRAIAVLGTDEISDAAKRSVRALIAWYRELGGGTQILRHGQVCHTVCPGPTIGAWVNQRCPAPATPHSYVVASLEWGASPTRFKAEDEAIAELRRVLDRYGAASIHRS